MRHLKKIIIALLMAAGLVATASPAWAFYSEAINAGNSDQGIVVSDGTNVYTVQPTQTIGGNLVGYSIAPYHCTSVDDLDSAWAMAVNGATTSQAFWRNFPYPGHHYYMFTWRAVNGHC